MEVTLGEEFTPTYAENSQVVRHAMSKYHMTGARAHFDNFPDKMLQIGGHDGAHAGRHTKLA